jgi:GNAT superfamily N-acetyltransferase
MTAPLGAARTSVPAPLSALSREERCPSREGVELTEDPTDEWLAALHVAEPTPWDAAGRAALLRRRTPPRRHAAVRVDGRVVAVARCVVEDGWAGFASVATAAEHRRQGHALAMTAALTAWALSAGARSAYLQVLVDNEPARTLYRSMGFTEHHVYAYHARPAGQTEKK